METKVKRLYDIDIFRLDNGEHQFEMEVNDEFFALFDYGLVEKGKAKVDILLQKSDTMISLNMTIRGAAELICDRSLEPFMYPVELEERLLVKYGEEEEELDDDLLIITKNTQKINLAQFIYEIIGISLPMKKIHPDYLDEEDEEDFDEEHPVAGRIVYSSIAEEAEEEEKPESEDEEIDPRWAILKNLRNN